MTEQVKNIAANRVQLNRPAYVSYGHNDLDEASAFARDFGLLEAGSIETPVPTRFFRGYGDLPLTYVVEKTASPVFLGVTFEVCSVADLERAEHVPGAKKRESMAHQPGGGERVSINGPESIPFHVIYGHKFVERKEPPPQMHPLNYPAESDENTTRKPRRGEMQRPELGPAPIHKLGHCGFAVSDLPNALAFYTTHFNFVPSDKVTHPLKPGEELFIFLHIDKGKAFTDHHSFFLTANLLQPVGVHHAAFELNDFDVQYIAHEFLKKKGYKPHWGIGRHVAGSQIFDYWHDKSGFVLEHYTDGDLVNDETSFKEFNMHDTLTTWGPTMPHLSFMAKLRLALQVILIKVRG